MSDKKIDMVTNRFDLILAASARVRELKRGHRPKIATKNREFITSINEFEQGVIGKEYLKRIK
jgi:DNA-directed RNA polymerase subunit K/omega